MKTTIIRFLSPALFAATAAACAVPTSASGDESRESTATTSAALTNCESFNLSMLKLYPDTSAQEYARVLDTSVTGTFGFYSYKSTAQRFLDVAKFYGMGQYCKVRDGSSVGLQTMSYMLTPSGSAPSVAQVMAGETCTAFDPNALQIVWDDSLPGDTLKAGAVRLIDFAEDYASLVEMKATIVANRFVSRCLVGDSLSAFSFEYWKIAAPVYVSTPQGNILVPVAPAPAAPTGCSASVGCHDAAVASCQHAPGGPAYYLKRGNTPIAGPVSPGATTFVWTGWGTGLAHDTVEICARTTGGEACSAPMTVTFPHKACPILGQLDGGGGGGGLLE